MLVGGGFDNSDAAAAAGMPIKAHKTLLTAASDHLHAAFTTVNYDIDKNFYEIEEIPHEILRQIVDYIYTRQAQL